MHFSEDLPTTSLIFVFLDPEDRSPKSCSPLDFQVDGAMSVNGPDFRAFENGPTGDNICQSELDDLSGIVGVSANCYIIINNLAC